MSQEVPSDLLYIDHQYYLVMRNKKAYKVYFVKSQNTEHEFMHHRAKSEKA